MFSHRYLRLSQLLSDRKLAAEQMRDLKFAGTMTFWFGAAALVGGVVEAIGLFQSGRAGSDLMLSCGLLIIILGLQQRERAEIIEALVEIAEKI